MPRISKQDRYALLLIPENEYNAVNPHPDTQTFYSYPVSGLQICISLCSTTIAMNLSHWLIPETGLAWMFAIIDLTQSLLYILIHPAVGLHRCRFVETPTGVQKIHVRRPLFGRRKCESRYGLTGGSPYKVYRLLGIGKEIKLRCEPALWVVDW